ncbi:hypothetical protein DM02DRAFT_631818 [Periconia macrospinosa]|uniref:Uncharacterized protein n=1 Tax=Periconia macrospinosa TaxID=97972 RepID=A0A2V1DHK2_9PLEO|nr:hypothetical protein DM02DRAFT_631818 [Periconia macrospinosa]
MPKLTTNPNWKAPPSEVGPPMVPATQFGKLKKASRHKSAKSTSNKTSRSPPSNPHTTTEPVRTTLPSHDWPATQKSWADIQRATERCAWNLDVIALSHQNLESTINGLPDQVFDSEGNVINLAGRKADMRSEITGASVALDQLVQANSTEAGYVNSVVSAVEKLAGVEMDEEVMGSIAEKEEHVSSQVQKLMENMPANGLFGKLMNLAKEISKEKGKQPLKSEKTSRSDVNASVPPSQPSKNKASNATNPPSASISSSSHAPVKKTEKKQEGTAPCKPSKIPVPKKTIVEDKNRASSSKEAPRAPSGTEARPKPKGNAVERNPMKRIRPAEPAASKSNALQRTNSSQHDLEQEVQPPKRVRPAELSASKTDASQRITSSQRRVPEAKQPPKRLRPAEPTSRYQLSKPVPEDDKPVNPIRPVEPTSRYQLSKLGSAAAPQKRSEPTGHTLSSAAKVKKVVKPAEVAREPASSTQSSSKTNVKGKSKANVAASVPEARASKVTASKEPAKKAAAKQQPSKEQEREMPEPQSQQQRRNVPVNPAPKAGLKRKAKDAEDTSHKLGKAPATSPRKKAAETLPNLAPIETLPGASEGEESDLEEGEIRESPRKKRKVEKHSRPVERVGVAHTNSSLERNKELELELFGASPPPPEDTTNTPPGTPPRSVNPVPDFNSIINHAPSTIPAPASTNLTSKTESDSNDAGAATTAKPKPNFPARRTTGKGVARPIRRKRKASLSDIEEEDSPSLSSPSSSSSSDDDADDILTRASMAHARKVHAPVKPAKEPSVSQDTSRASTSTNKMSVGAGTKRKVPATTDEVESEDEKRGAKRARKGRR